MSSLEETWYHLYSEACRRQHQAVGMFFSDRKTSQDWGKYERSKVQKDPWWKPAPEFSGPQTGQTYTFQQDDDPSTQLRQRRSDFRTSLWMSLSAALKPGLEPDRTSLKRPENSYAATLPIQPDRARQDLQRRMEETPQKKQVCQACSVTPKKNRCCNRCQRCFNKVLSKGSEYLHKCHISVFYF